MVKIDAIEFVNDGDGELIFYFHWIAEHCDVKDAIIQWMAARGYEYLKDYTINSSKLIPMQSNRILLESRQVKVILCDPEDFVMLKLTYVNEF